jgi:predicted permease
MNAVLPIFIIIALGSFLKHKQMITDDFVTKSMKLVFNICLPGMLFIKVRNSDISLVFQADSLVFATVITVLTLLLFLFAKIYANYRIKIPADRGTFVQGTYRSNYIFIGYSVLYNLFGETIISRMALLVIIIIPLYNILAIWVLTDKGQESNLQNLLHVLIKIIKNPLIIGIFLGFLFSLFKIPLPTFIVSTITMLGDVGTPLGLLGIGTYMTFTQLKSYRAELVAVIIKIILSPFIAVTVAYFLGFSYLDTTLIFVLFGSPTAITSFIMATAMGGNKKLAANIVIFSTLLSLITFLIGLTILASLYAV